VIAQGDVGYLYFWGVEGGKKFRHSAGYLARKEPEVIDRADGFEYFAGVGANGQPRFAASESDAAGKLQVDDCMGEVGVVPQLTWIIRTDAPQHLCPLSAPVLLTATGQAKVRLISLPSIPSIFCRGQGVRRSPLWVRESRMVLWGVFHRADGEPCLAGESSSGGDPRRPRYITAAIANRSSFLFSDAA